MTTKCTSTTTKTTKNDFNALKKALFDKLYNNLNDRQREAVLRTEGAMLVLAGAGSGKTTVLVNRIAQILQFGVAYDTVTPPQSEEVMKKASALLEGGSNDAIRAFLGAYAVGNPRPDEILCLTFTNKAAGEFKTRLEKLLGVQAHDIWAGTFHSICARILRRHISRLGYGNDFTIYDSDDSKKLIAECMKTLGTDEKLLAVRSVQSDISKAKEGCISALAYGESTGQNYKKKQVAEIYELYEKNLHDANALDFDDLIFKTIELFSEHTDVLELYKRRFCYVMADEYQDTNRSQSILIEMLSSGSGNICVVGDDDQSIYAFRGATVENILGFDKSFPDVHTIRLEQNYRSTKSILNAANALIANNVSRKGKTLHTDNEEGAKVLVKRHYTQSEEATYIMSTIRQRVAQGEAKYSDFAVLYRLNEQANALELIFSKSKIPYRIFGGLRFSDRKEIKDLTAYLSVVYNPDDNTRLKRIINVPRRQIGNTTVGALTALAAESKTSIYEIIKRAEEYPALAKTLVPLLAFRTLIEQLRETANNDTVNVLLEQIIEKTQYRTMLLLDPDPKEREKLALVDEFVSTAVDFENNSDDKSLGAFLEQLALVSDIDNYDETADAVALMTMHSAKGLEFPYVFLPGFEEGLFPSQRAVDNGELEEERRLAYVAMTRAEKELQILHTNTRLIYGRTTSNRRSRFIDELPEECVEFVEVQKPLNGIRQPESHTRHSRSLESFEKNIRRAPEQKSAEPQAASEVFETGATVTHRVFGRGKIISATPMGGDVLYAIEFETHGKRKLMGNLAKLERAE
ncbi:MAG TPA: 3'-5' exonuclease [Bacillota bacterium]|nr:3'-5' exonuclease [Bacillota bacterium]